jgi:hypothetical protein
MHECKKEHIQKHKNMKTLTGNPEHPPDPEPSLQFPKIQTQCYFCVVCHSFWVHAGDTMSIQVHCTQCFGPLYPMRYHHVHCTQCFSPLYPVRWFRRVACYIPLIASFYILVWRSPCYPDVRRPRVAILKHHPAIRASAAFHDGTFPSIAVRLPTGIISLVATSRCWKPYGCVRYVSRTAAHPNCNVHDEQQPHINEAQWLNTVPACTRSPCVCVCVCVCVCMIRNE